MDKLISIASFVPECRSYWLEREDFEGQCEVLSEWRERKCVDRLISIASVLPECRS